MFLLLLSILKVKLVEYIIFEEFNKKKTNLNNKQEIKTILQSTTYTLQLLTRKW